VLGPDRRYARVGVGRPDRGACQSVARQLSSASTGKPGPSAAGAFAGIRIGRHHASRVSDAHANGARKKSSCRKTSAAHTLLSGKKICQLNYGRRVTLTSCQSHLGEGGNQCRSTIATCSLALLLSGFAARRGIRGSGCDPGVMPITASCRSKAEAAQRALLARSERGRRQSREGTRSATPETSAGRVPRRPREKAALSANKVPRLRQRPPCSDTKCSRLLPVAERCQMSR